jgi:hypothetical protein
MSRNPAIHMAWLLYLTLPLTAMPQTHDPRVGVLVTDTAAIKRTIADQECRIVEGLCRSASLRRRLPGR